MERSISACSGFQVGSGLYFHCAPCPTLQKFCKETRPNELYLNDHNYTDGSRYCVISRWHRCMIAQLIRIRESRKERNVSALGLAKTFA
ncbi:hypothetical protein OG21DRAFT_1504788 [Imleria badia]|nr:hypothetical protein OG21DRAFT_1504788 [Imleria badia]